MAANSELELFLRAAAEIRGRQEDESEGPESSLCMLFLCEACDDQVLRFK